MLQCLTDDLHVCSSPSLNLSLWPANCSYSLQNLLLGPEVAYNVTQAQPACIILTNTTESNSFHTEPALDEVVNITEPAVDEAINIQHLRDNRTGPIFVIDATQQHEPSAVQQVLDWILSP